MLKEKKDEFQEMVLVEQAKMKDEIKQLAQIWQEFKDTASKNPDLDSGGAFKKLKNFNQLFSYLINMNQPMLSL